MEFALIAILVFVIGYIILNILEAGYLTRAILDDFEDRDED